MKQGRIIVISGAPGTGKTTISTQIADESDRETSVCLHTDSFYEALKKGAIPPYLPESKRQNQIVINAFLEAAKCFAHGGYDVIVDGVVGPWFLEPWLQIVRDGYEVHYIILRAAKEETTKRAIRRSKLDPESNAFLVETMWAQFTHLGRYEQNVLDTTDLSVHDTVLTVKKIIAGKSALLDP